MFAPLVLELLIVFLAALLLLHLYGQIRRQHLMVTIATLVAWYFSMIIVFILPLDVSSTFYRECIEKEKLAHQNTSTNTTNFKRELAANATTVNTTSNVTSTLSSTTEIQHDTVQPDATYVSTCLKPWSYVPENTLPTMWILVYWTSQFLTWLVLPFIQSYVCAGDFSIPGKMKRAVVENGLYYASYFVLFCCLLIYIVASPNIHFNISQLKVLVITASNTWGLFLLILLLGYGLVEVPRTWWGSSDVHQTLRKNYFRLSKLSTEKQEATENYEDLLEENKQISNCVNYSHPYRKFINIIISKCTDDFQRQLLDNHIDADDVTNSTSSRRNSDVIERSVPSEAGFVKLHKQLLQSTDTLRRTTVQYKICMDKCLQLENVQRNINNQADRVWKADSSLLASNSDIQESFVIRKFFSLKMKWKFYCEIQPLFRRIFSILLMILTVLVIWSECTFFNDHPVLSLFAVFINLAKSGYHYFYIELASMVVIFYLCFCAYFTVFRMKIFNYYYIANHHQTNESSLIFAGMILSRLPPPLCLNFLGLIHLDTGIEISEDVRVETAYTQIMGHLELIPFISEGFNIYFPIFVLLISVCTYFEVGSRILKFVGFHKLITSEVDDVMIDLINDGKQLVVRERRRVDRKLKQEDRSKQLDKLTNNSGQQWKGRYMKKHMSQQGGQSYQHVDDVTTSSNAMTSYNAITIDQYSDDDVSNITSSTSTNPRNLFDDI